MFSRRMFLGGSASTLWLPFLPSALPRTAWAAPSPAAPRRLLYWFVPNGLLADELQPVNTGPYYDLPYALEPILPIQSRVTVVSGIEDKSTPTIAGGHDLCMIGMLADHTLNNTSPVLDASVTVDQYAAQNMTLATPFQSMQLGIDQPWLESPGNANVYHTTFSWSNGQTPLTPLTDPKTVFDRMFVGSDPLLTEKEIARRTALRRSLLDALVDRTAALNRTLSVDDKVKLDQFTTGIRDLEVRMDAIGEIQCETPAAPGTGLAFAENVTAMSDLISIAFQCDFTRIITFATGASTALTVYDFLGTTMDHHTLSHQQTVDEAAKTKLLTIQSWQVSMWTALCQKLAAVPEDRGDMLSNTLANLVTEFGQSGPHTASPMVLLFAGGEAGGIVQGQHRNYASGTYSPHSNLWWSELEYMGVDPTGFGENATGAFDLST